MRAYPSTKKRQAANENLSVGVSQGKSCGGVRTTSACCLNDITSVLNTGKIMMKQTTMAATFVLMLAADLRAAYMRVVGARWAVV